MNTTAARARLHELIIENPWLTTAELSVLYGEDIVGGAFTRAATLADLRHLEDARRVRRRWDPTAPAKNSKGAARWVADGNGTGARPMADLFAESAWALAERDFLLGLDFPRFVVWPILLAEGDRHPAPWRAVSAPAAPTPAQNPRTTGVR